VPALTVDALQALPRKAGIHERSKMSKRELIKKAAGHLEATRTPEGRSLPSSPPPNRSRPPTNVTAEPSIRKPSAGSASSAAASGT